MQNFMKTIFSAFQNWTKKEIKKNRTHWEEEVTVPVAPKQIVGYYGAAGLSNGFEPEEGATYIVTCNGTRYELTAWYSDYCDWTVIGNSLYVDGTDDGSGVPFAFDGYDIYAPFGVYTMSVSTVVDGVETEVIEEQTRYIYVNFALGEYQLEAGNVYNINFDGIDYEFTAVENLEASSIIVGNMEHDPCEIWCQNGWLNLYSLIPGVHTFALVDITNDSQIVEERYVGFAADCGGVNIQNLQEGVTYTVIWNGKTYTCVANKSAYDEVYIGNIIYPYCNGWEGYPDVVDTGEPFFICTHAEDNYSCVMCDCGSINTFAISDQKTVVHKLDSKYLPALDWNQNDPDGDGYIKNRPFYEECIIDEVLFDGDVTLNEYGQFNFDPRIDLQEGVTYCVILDDYIGEATAYYDDTDSSIAVYMEIGGAGLSVYSLCVYAYRGVDGSNIYANTTHYLKVYRGSVNLVTIDNKYLDLHVYKGDGEGAMRINSMSNTASGDYSHAEGSYTTASGGCSHTEGYDTTASGNCSHAEGYDTTASGDYSHAEGGYTTASGDYSHAEGQSTIANFRNQHVIGKFNVGNRDAYFEKTEKTTTTSKIYATTFYFSKAYTIDHSKGLFVLAEPITAVNLNSLNSNVLSQGSWYLIGNGTSGKTMYSLSKTGGMATTIGSNYANVLTGTRHTLLKCSEYLGEYVSIVGNGTSDTSRSNAYTLDWNGVGWYQGGLQVGGNAQDDGAKNVLVEGDAIRLEDVRVAFPSFARYAYLAYGNGKFVVVAYDGSSIIYIAYSEDGLNWTQTTLPDLPAQYMCDCVTYGNDKFVALCYTRNGGTSTSIYSEDGITWTQTTMPVPAAQYNSVTYGNGKFVAVGMHTDISAYSEDGITWTQTTMPANSAWCSVAYGNGKFVAVGDIAAYSEDGTTWTKINLPGLSRWRSVAYYNGKFVAISGTISAYSEDGITWTQQAIPFYVQESVAYGNGKFVAVGYNTTDTAISAYSEDGIAWTHTTMPVKSTWRSVVYGNGKFVAAGNNGTFAYSEDGITWCDNYNILTQDNENIIDDVKDIILEDAILTPLVAQVGQVLSVKSVDDNGKPTEWEVVDDVKSWNDLQDKPFYAEEKKMLVAEGIPDMYGKYNPVDISIEIGKEYIYFIDGIKYTGIGYYDESSGNSVDLEDAGGTVVAYLSPSTIELISGQLDITTSHKIELVEYVVHKIDAKYLPDILSSIATAETWTFTLYDGSTVTKKVVLS